ncbi:MAG: hypothetical protein ACRDWW_00330 [Acidimicrobiales bacterium]
MVSRVRWLGAGAAVGVGASVWAQRKVKSLVARYHPAGRAGDTLERARAFSGDVRAALQEGRATMREREAELRGGLAERRSARGDGK